MASYGFNSALMSTLSYIRERPSDSILSDFGAADFSALPSRGFLTGLFPDEQLSGLLGDALPSRRFAHFGSADGMTGRAPRGFFGLPDFASQFLSGGLLFGGGSFLGLPTQTNAAQQIGALGGGGRVPGIQVAPPNTTPLHSAPQPDGSGGSMRFHTPREGEDEGVSGDFVSRDDIDAAAGTLVENGYGREEAAAIADRAEREANGDRGDFRRIVGGGMPQKPTQGDLSDEAYDQKLAAWHRQFGEWYAHNVLGLDAAQSTDFVQEVAYAPGDASAGGSFSVRRDTSSPGSNKGWRITDDPGFGGYEKGKHIFEKGGQWYRDSGCTDRIENITVSGSGQTRTVMIAASDPDDEKFYELSYVNLNDHGLEIYDYIDEDGDTGAVYRSRDGTWFTNSAGTTKLAGDPKRVRNRLVFARGPREPIPGLTDARQYMQHLDGAIAGYRSELEDVEAERKRVDADRVTAFQERVQATLPSDAPMAIDANAESGRIEITVPPEKAADAAKLFGSGTGTIDKGNFNEAFELLPHATTVILTEFLFEKHFNEAFELLPHATGVEFNGATISVRGDAHARLGRVVRAMPRPVTVAEIDASSAGDLRGVRRTVRSALRQAVRTSGARKASKLTITELTIPENTFTESQIKEVVAEEGARVMVEGAPAPSFTVEGSYKGSTPTPPTPPAGGAAPSGDAPTAGTAPTASTAGGVESPPADDSATASAEGIPPIAPQTAASPPETPPAATADAGATGTPSTGETPPVPEGERPPSGTALTSEDREALADLEPVGPAPTDSPSAPETPPSATTGGERTANASATARTEPAPAPVEAPPPPPAPASAPTNAQSDPSGIAEIGLEPVVPVASPDRSTAPAEAPSPAADPDSLVVAHGESFRLSAAERGRFRETYKQRLTDAREAVRLDLSRRRRAEDAGRQIFVDLSVPKQRALFQRHLIRHTTKWAVERVGSGEAIDAAQQARYTYAVFAEMKRLSELYETGSFKEVDVGFARTRGENGYLCATYTRLDDDGRRTRRWVTDIHRPGSFTMPDFGSGTQTVPTYTKAFHGNQFHLVQASDVPRTSETV